MRFTSGRSIYSFTCFPDFATSGNIVVNYQGDKSRLPVPGNGETIHDVIPNLDRDGVPYSTINTDLRVSRFTLSAAHIADAVANSMSATENQAALDTEFPYINQAEQNSIHTVLDCKFGPDGYLFITFGDEGGQPDPHRNGQRITKDYFSSLLRIDVNPGSTNPKPNPHYTIAAGPLNNGVFPFFTDADSQEPNFRVPADNPFIHTSLDGSWSGDFNGTDLSGQLDEVRTEIWALGLRTPFRFHIDTEDGTGETEAWVGDVGFETWEEINLLKKGDNGGWSYYEGPIRTPGLTHASMPSGSTPNKPAIFSYETDSLGNSVTGGIFYRSDTLPSLTNTYIFGDYGSGRIFSLTREGASTELGGIRLGGNDIVDFELDAETGEILVLEHGPSGRVMRITEETNPPANFPLTLSDTGVFADLSDLSPNPGIIPYTPNLKFWSDDADKSRWFVIPNLTDTIGYSLNDPWSFPEGMIWIKHFDFDLDQSNPGTDIQRLETRLLVRNASGSYGVSYRWRNDEDEADLADNIGEEFEINFTNAKGQPASFTWRIPSRAECLTCHNPEAGHALSLNTRQFNLTNTINGQTGNLLTLLNDAGYLSGFEDDPATLPRHYQPDEAEVDLEARVRSYLDVNCAYCHFPDGGTPHSWDARAYLPTTSTNMLYGVPISEGAPNETDLIIQPVNKPKSSIWNKINARGATNGTFNGHSQMPPLASNRLDPKGIALIAEWIDNYANVAPSVPTLPLATAAEDTPLGTAITSAAANDPDVRNGITDQSQLTFAITGGNTEAHFAIDPVTGEVTVTKELDYEQADSHVFEITVSDNFAPNPKSAVGNIMVNVSDVESVDEDGNGVPDAWEKLYGISDAPVGNDADKDGLPDFFELVTGSNPVSPVSLSVIALDPLAPGGTTYSWRYDESFLLGTDYLLQGSSNMSDWPELVEDADYVVVSDVTDGDGYRRITIRLSNPPEPRHFLRLSSP
jgi:glucose/arabinose dehydrogenase/mono/diheme cytochrome c family protein